MAIGFRKSLFGFNTKEVMEYIEVTKTTFERKIAQLQEQTVLLEEQNKTLNKTVATLTAQKNQIQAQLDEYNRKYADIERLAENIGKLYLVSQTNAKEIMNRSTESSNAANSQVENNLSVIDEAHNSMTELETMLNETSKAFTAKMEEMMASLADTKDRILQNQQAEESAKEQFAEIYELLDR